MQKLPAVAPTSMANDSQDMGTAVLKEWDYLCDILGPLIRKL